MWWKDMKMRVIIAIGIAVLIVIIVVPIVKAWVLSFLRRADFAVSRIKQPPILARMAVVVMSQSCVRQLYFLCIPFVSREYVEENRSGRIVDMMLMLFRNWTVFIYIASEL